MRLDLGTRAGWSRDHLNKFLRLFKRINTSHIFVLAMDEKLKLSGCESTNNTQDKISITVPYFGDPVGGFARTQDFIAATRGHEEVIDIVEAAKPVDWVESIGKRINELTGLDSAKLLATLNYLLQIDFYKTRKEAFKGLIVTKGEFMAFDGYRMHIDATQPNMIHKDHWEGSKGRALMGLSAAKVMQQALLEMPTSRVYGGYQSSEECRGFLFQFKQGGIDVRLSSRCLIDCVDTDNARAAGTENNGSLVVYNDHLQSVLSEALKSARRLDSAKAYREGRVAIKLTHELSTEGHDIVKTESRYYYKDKYRINRISPIGTHQLICTPGNDFMRGMPVILDANYLVQASKDLGPHIQFIVPADPIKGLQDCGITPVYVTGLPGRFAVLAPMEPDSIT